MYQSQYIHKNNFLHTLRRNFGFVLQCGWLAGLHHKHQSIDSQFCLHKYVSKAYPESALACHVTQEVLQEVSVHLFHPQLVLG